MNLDRCAREHARTPVLHRPVMRWMLAGMLLLVGCGENGLFGSEVDGKVAAAVAEFKTKWEMTPTACYSGERAGFFGVDLAENDDQETLVRIVSDPIDGFSVGTNVPRQDVAVFVSAADGCETFDVDVVRTNTRVNNIWAVDGHALVDCDLPGLSFHVDVNFAGCH